MEIEEIYPTVRDIIVESCGIPEDEITPDATLFDELEIDSIDLVDILFELESAYGVALRIRDIENESRLELADKPFEIDGIITDEGRAALMKNVPEIRPELLVPGLTIHELVNLANVQLLCRLVKFKTDQNSNPMAGSGPT